MIELKNVSFSNSEKEILQNINLQIESDKRYLLLGPSGSGKTTLLKLCNNLISPTYGEIFLQNESYQDLSPIEIRKTVSLIMQNPILFGDLVSDNFKFVNELNDEKLSPDDFVELMKKLKLPANYFQKKNEELSGGEKQRVSVIRSLMNKPKFILADEPFSALDKSRIINLMNLFIECVTQEKIGLLIISHFFGDIISQFDKVIFVYKGKIEFVGKPQDFLKSDNEHIKNFLAGKDE